MILYKNTKIKVPSPDRNTDLIDIVVGVLPGDTSAQYLFLICLDYVFRTSVDLMEEKGFTLAKVRSKRCPTQTITDAHYVDDIALLTNTPTQVKSMLDCLEKAAGGIGLHVHADKTEYMCFNQNKCRHLHSKRWAWKEWQSSHMSEAASHLPKTTSIPN